MKKSPEKSCVLAHQASIRDVAALAEVSQATVSMVLNNKECISPEARHRVLDAVKKLQYRRRGVGRPSLYETRRPTPRNRVVFQLPRIEDAIHTIYAKVLRGAENVLREHNLDLSVQSFETPVYSREIIGILSVGKSRAHGQLPEVVLMGLPVREQVDQITYDNREIGIIAAQCSQEHPIPRVSFFNFSEPIFEERIEFFRILVQKQGKEVYVPERLSHAVLDDRMSNRRCSSSPRRMIPRCWPIRFFCRTISCRDAISISSPATMNRSGSTLCRTAPSSSTSARKTSADSAHCSCCTAFPRRTTCRCESK